MYNGKRQPTACTQNAHSFRKTVPSRTQTLLRETWLWGRAGGAHRTPRGAGCRRGGRGGGGRWSRAFPDYSSQRARARAGLQPGHKLFPATEMCVVCTGDALETNPVSTLAFSLPPASQFWACVPKSLSSFLGLSP